MSANDDDVTAEELALLRKLMRASRKKEAIHNGHLTVWELYEMWIPSLHHEVEHGAYRGRRVIALSHRSYITRPICKSSAPGAPMYSFGSLPLSAVNPETIEAWRIGLEGIKSQRGGKPLAKGTVAHARALVQSCLKWHVKKGTIDRNPLRDVPPWYKINELGRRRGSFSPAELSAFIAELPPVVAAMWLLGARTGLRKTEFRLLKKDNVNISRRMLVGVLGKGRKPRDLPIPDDLVGMLVHWIGCSSSEYVFTNSSRAGSPPVSEDRLRKAIEAARKSTGITLDGELPTNHHLRHTFAIDQLEAGLPPTFLQAVLGHSSTAEIDRVYGKFRGRTSMEFLREKMNKAPTGSPQKVLFTCPGCLTPHDTGDALKACMRSHDGPEDEPAPPTKKRGSN